MYFANSILKKNTNIFCIIEKNKVAPSFKTKVTFESYREKFEKNKWFKNSKPKFLPQTYSTHDINSSKVINLLKKKKTKYILIFGTKKLNLKNYKKFRNKIFNFHGGNPEKYRGLDSHYWAIYHRDFNSVETCMHLAAHKLDTGKILYREKIKINHNTKIYELRSMNTEVCLKQALKFLSNLKEKIKLRFKKQEKEGRYYSFMPAVLKNELQKKIKLR